MSPLPGLLDLSLLPPSLGALLFSQHPAPRSAVGCVSTAAGRGSLLGPPCLAACIPLIVAFLISDVRPHHLTRTVLFKGPNDVFFPRSLTAVAGTADLPLLWTL